MTRGDVATLSGRIIGLLLPVAPSPGAPGRRHPPCASCGARAALRAGRHRDPRYAQRRGRVRSSPLWIVAQALRDPGNIGTILRTGDATAAGGLILIDDSADPYSVEAVRASMGAIFTQRVAIARWEAFVAWLRSGPGQLVGTSLKTDHDYLEPIYQQPCFLLIGNESQGLPAEYESECDLLVKMPMLGRADSLNAAVAAAVMAFQVRASWRNP